MIHRKAVCLSSLLLALCLLFSGCGSSSGGSSSSASSGASGQGTITPGTWDGTTFVNTWSGMKLTLPETFMARGDMDMSSLFETDASVKVNNGKITKDDLNFGELSTFYDFFLTSAMENTHLILRYQNLANESGGDITVEQYFSTIRQQLEANEEIHFAFQKEYDVMIAGQKFYAARTTINDGAVYQEYFLRKVDGAIICLLASYTKDSAQDMQNLLNSFTPAQ